MMSEEKGKLDSTTDVNWEKDVLKSEKPVLVDFWAQWCGPCLLMVPQLEQAAAQLGDKVKVYKLNVDENPAASTKYGIMGIPSLLLFKDGKEVKRLVGLQTTEALVKEIQQAL